VFDEGGIIGVIAQDMDGDGRNDLVITQQIEGKRRTTIVPWSGNKFDSSFELTRNPG
jgi:SH3-like domain-containing protein